MLFYNWSVFTYLTVAGHKCEVNVIVIDQMALTLNPTPILTPVDINALGICLTPCILQIQSNLCGVE